jgi:hypothetical protein
MSLESKAKTYLELTTIDLKQDVTTADLEKKWVPLEEAQKLEVENKEWHDYFCKRDDEYPCIKKINTLKAKIAEANKALEAKCDYCHDASELEVCEKLQCGVLKARKILSGKPT